MARDALEPALCTGEGLLLPRLFEDLAGLRLQGLDLVRNDSKLCPGASTQQRLGARYLGGQLRGLKGRRQPADGVRRAVLRSPVELCLLAVRHCFGLCHCWRVRPPSTAMICPVM